MFAQRIVLKLRLKNLDEISSILYTAFNRKTYLRMFFEYKDFGKRFNHYDPVIMLTDRSKQRAFICKS